MIRASALALAMGCAAWPSYAQISGPPIRSALPNVSSVSASNAAGVLQYCMSKQLVSSTNAGRVLEGLTKKTDVTNSSDFTAGASGQILGDKSFSIGSAPGFLQSDACDLVLKRAKQFH